MKSFTKILALTLVVVMSVLMLVSCSSYRGIKNAFEDAGYTLQNEDNEKSGEIKTDEGTITYTIHTFKKGLSYVIVWEFGSDKDMSDAISESEILSEIGENLQESKFVNGNCVLVPTLDIDAIEAFNSTKK